VLPSPSVVWAKGEEGEGQGREEQGGGALMIGPSTASRMAVLTRMQRGALALSLWHDEVRGTTTRGYGSTNGVHSRGRR